MARKLIVEIIGDSKSLERSFARSSQASKKFGQDMQKSVRGAVVGTGAFRSLGRSVAFASGAFLGGAGLGAAVSGAFKELNDARVVAAQTNAVLKSTGGVAGVTATQVNALGDALLRKTGIDDEQIKATENLLLTFTNIRNEVGDTNDIFNQATKATLDMSVALGEDTTSSAIRLGKALQDPVRGVTALRRVGVALTEAQQSQIKAFVETGRVMDAQKIILRELTTEFGGSAEAAGNVQPWNKLRETIRNFSAELASDALPAIQDYTKAIQDFFDNAENTQRIKNDLANITDTIKGIFTLDFSHPPRWVESMDESFQEKVNGWKRAINDVAGGAIFRGVPAAPLPGIKTPAGLGKPLTSDVFAGLGVDPLAGIADALRAGRRTGAKAESTRLKNLTKTPFRSFELALAEATRARQDDEAALRGIITVLRQRIGSTTNLAAKTDLQEALNQYQGQLSGLLADDAQDVKNAAAKVKEKRQAARQAAKDALTGLASSLADQVSSLREQAARIRQEDIARRSQFETPLRLQLAQAQAEATGDKKGLRSAIVAARTAARKALKSGDLLINGQIDAWNAITQANERLKDKLDGDIHTKFHKASAAALASGLGLSADAKRELEGRLSRIGAGGKQAGRGSGAFGQTIVIKPPDVILDGKKVSQSTTTHQQARDRRNPRQKRGALPHGI